MRKYALPALLFVASFVINTKIKAQTTVYVDSSAKGLNNGSSWANAYRSLDSIVSKPESQLNFDTVKIAKGIYKPTLKPKSSASNDPRDVCFYLPYAVYMGGYASGGGVQDYKANATILSGDIGTSGNSIDNAYHVIVVVSEIFLKGVIVENGNANGAGNLLVGSNIMQRNSGGGIYSIGNAYITIDNCVLQNNKAVNGGGGYIPYSSINFLNCVFQNNSAATGGGFFSIDNYSLFSGNVFINNDASISGGGLFVSATTSFYNNEVSNSLFIKNTAGSSGGGLYNTAKSFDLKNCTVYGNSSGQRGGGFFNGSNDPANAYNSIFYKNGLLAGTEGEDVYDSAAMLNAANCILQSFAGAKNSAQAEDVFFKDSANLIGADGLWRTGDDGLRITVRSPAFNRGNNDNAPFFPTFTDITGATRVRNNIVDIGAYEIEGCSSFSTNIAYVDSAAKGNSSGSSWANAYTSLQAALNLKLAGCIDTIKVAKGNYYPEAYPFLDVSAKSDQESLSFVLPDGIKIIGGFASGGSTYNPSQYPTILNGTILQSRTTGLVSHVIIAAAVRGIYLQGLCVMNGYAYGGAIQLNGRSISWGYGGGLLADGAEFLMRDCLFSNNAAFNGGAISASESAIIMERTVIKNNRSLNASFQGGGAGLYFWDLDAGSKLYGCSIDSNAGALGGGIYNARTTGLTIDSCSFSKNSASYPGGNVVGGGGIYNIDCFNTLFYNCTFKNNSAYLGGAINSYSYNEGSSTFINKCKFVGNTAVREGGGVYVGGSVYVYNSIFYDNSSTETWHGAGAFSSYYAQGQIVNCTFFENKSKGQTGAVFANGVAVFNSLFWRNRINGDTSVAGADLSGATSNNLLQSYQYNNIAGIYPMLRDTANPAGVDGIWGTNDDGLIPLLKSPAINTGINSWVPEGITTDILGRPRIVALTVDIGAYEMDYCNESFLGGRIAYVDSSAATGSQTGGSWANAFTDLQDAINAFNSGCVDTVKVAKGSYYPTLDFGGTKYTTNPESINKTFTIPTGISILGGYPSGGGIRNASTNLTIIDGEHHLRPVYLNEVTNVEISGITIKNGWSFDYFGAGFRATKSSFTLQDCIVESNYAGMGAGLYLSGCTGKLVNCIIDSNRASEMGGGLMVNSSDMDFINCIFYNNTAYYKGGAAVLTDNSRFLNCTFSNNSAGYLPCIVYDNPSSPVFANCIFYSNRPLGYNADSSSYDIVVNDVFGGKGNAKIVNCLLQYPIDGAINSFARQYPLFKDSANPAGADGLWRTPDDGLQLAGGSPAINKGNNDSAANIENDILGYGRIKFGTVDMGTYEFGSFSGNEICVGGNTLFVGGLTGNNILHKWQVDEGAGFGYLSNDSHYAGTQTDSLTILGSPSVWYGYRYRCEYSIGGAKQYSQIFTLKFSNVWTGAVNTAWENAANWSCGIVPDTNTDVIISAGTAKMPFVNENTSVRSISAASGTYVSVKTGVILNISGK